jgi:mono/diheme cytochrome c family protein
VLERVDRAVAWASWVGAALIVLMLLIGPRLIAADESSPASGAASDGRAVFVENCGGCHTLAAAGTSGQVGPSLDGISLGAADVEAIVRSGSGGIMPAFEGDLSAGAIAAVAAFVAGGQ